MSYRPKYNDSDNNKVDLPIDAETLAGHTVESSGVDSNTSTLPTTAQVKAYADYVVATKAGKAENNTFTGENTFNGNVRIGPNDSENWYFRGDSLILDYSSHNINYVDDNHNTTLSMYMYDHEFELYLQDFSTDSRTTFRVEADHVSLDRQPEAEWNLLTNKTWLVKTQYYSLSSEGVLGVVNNLDLSSFEITDINDALDFRTDYSVCLNILYDLARALLTNNSNCLGYSANSNAVKITENDLTLFVENIDSNTIQYRVKDTSDDDNPSTYRLSIVKSGNTYTKQESGNDIPKFTLIPIYTFYK